MKLTQRPALDNQHTFKVSYLNELGNLMLFESPGVIFSNENN
ncbi:hypothetical protein [Marinicellulosiphila megalodicopiae]